MEQFTPPEMHQLPHRNCWSSIGVRGDKSCQALAEHAHCRNCPTYSQIAATLLDRAVLHEPGDDWAEHYGAIAGIEKSKDQSAVIFRIGSEWLGIATQALDEVIELRAVHRLPHRHSPVVLGVANVRGELVVCVALDRLLGIVADPPEASKTRRLLVLRSASGRLAVPVDEVQHTHSYRSDDIIAPPTTIARSTSSYTTTLLPWRGRTVARLNETRVIEAFESSLG